jgi:hypothetical protein
MMRPGQSKNLPISHRIALDPCPRALSRRPQRQRRDQPRPTDPCLRCASILRVRRARAFAKAGGSLLDGLDLRPRPEAACVRGRAGANLCGRRRRLGRRRRVHGEEPTEARVGLSRESSRSHPSRAARRVVRAQTPRRYILSESMHGGWPDCPHTRVHRAGRLTNADMVTWGSPSASMRTRLCGK